MKYTIVDPYMFDFNDSWSVSEALPNQPYYYDRNNKIKLYCYDTFSILPQIPDSCVDLIFTDPPYFLSSGGITCQNGRMVSVDKGEWDKLETIQEVHEFNMRWIRECQRILKPNGTIWICGTSHNIFSVGLALQEAGCKILNDIIWEKPAPPPNLSCRYFTHASEHLIWAAKNKKSKHTFNYKVMKKIAGGKQMKSVWHDIWLLPSVKKEEKIFGKHPTQKPAELVRRAVLASSQPVDIVLDPFCGSGTTGVVCKEEKRRFVGIDSEEKFLKVAVKRIETAHRIKEDE